MISRTHNDIENEEQQENQENEPNEVNSSGASQRVSSHVEKLSPVEIVTISSEAISESLDPPSAKGRSSVLSGSMKPNKALCRSLFGFNPTTQSTPLRSNQPMAKIATPAGNISPIYPSPESPKPTSKQASKAHDVHVPAVEQNHDVPMFSKEKSFSACLQIAEVCSIAQLEAELQSQYQISEKSVSRRQKKTEENQPGSSFTSQQQAAAREGDIMDIEESLVPPSRRSSLRKAINQTDVNSVRMVETMLNYLHPATPVICKELAVHLRRCNETSDESQDAESESDRRTSKRESSPNNEKAQAKRKKPNSLSLRLQKTSKISTINNTRATEANALPLKPVQEGTAQRSTATSGTSPNRTSSSELMSEQTSSSPVNTFEPPQMEVEVDPIPMTNAELESNHSIAEVLPPDVLSSFRSLPKRKINESKDAQESIQARVTINVPKKKSRTMVNSSAQSYLELSKRKTGRSNKNDDTISKKRTLYSVHSPDVRQKRCVSFAPPQCSEIGSTQMTSEEASLIREGEATTSPDVQSDELFKEPASETRKTTTRNDSDSSAEEPAGEVPGEDNHHREIVFKAPVVAKKKKAVKLKRKIIKTRGIRPTKYSNSSEDSEDSSHETEAHKESDNHQQEKEINTLAAAKKKVSSLARKKRARKDSESTTAGIASQQTEAREDSDQEEENESPAVEKEKALKSKKVSSKVIHPRKDLESPAEGSSPQSSDEGFISGGKSSRNDFLYDPCERGCLRQGLRMRRVMKPYWIQTAEAENYAITYGTVTRKQVMAELKLKVKLKKAQLTDNNFVKAGHSCMFLQSEEKLKILEENFKRPFPPASLSKSRASSKAPNKSSDKVTKKQAPRRQVPLKKIPIDDTESQMSQQSEANRANNTSKERTMRNILMDNTLTSVLQSIRAGSSISSITSRPSIQCESFGEWKRILASN